MSPLSPWIEIVTSLFIGFTLGRWLEENIWIRKGRKEYRTANCARGKFYYVITEEEYVEKFLKEYNR